MTTSKRDLVLTEGVRGVHTSKSGTTHGTTSRSTFYRKFYPGVYSVPSRQTRPFGRNLHNCTLWRYLYETSLLLRSRKWSTVVGLPSFYDNYMYDWNHPPRWCSVYTQTTWVLTHGFKGPPCLDPSPTFFPTTCHDLRFSVSYLYRSVLCFCAPTPHHVPEVELGDVTENRPGTDWHPLSTEDTLYTHVRVLLH